MRKEKYKAEDITVRLRRGSVYANEEWARDAIIRLMNEAADDIDALRAKLEENA